MLKVDVMVEVSIFASEKYQHHFYSLLLLLDSYSNQTWAINDNLMVSLLLLLLDLLKLDGVVLVMKSLLPLLPLLVRNSLFK